MPTDPRTLAQIYRRWLYQDYIAWWHDQSVATKRLWETNARPYHMTGFAYWMKYHLNHLDDIALGLHLDHKVGSSTPDFSKNDLLSTCFGTYIDHGAISTALHFDGIDDYVTLPHSPITAPATPFSFSFFFYAKTLQSQPLVSKGDSTPLGAGYSIRHWTNVLYHPVYDITGTRQQAFGLLPVSQNTIHHVYWEHDGSTVSWYLDGVFDNSFPCNGIKHSTDPLTLGAWAYNPALQNFHGFLDELRLSNRILTLADTKRHAERRYP